MFLNFIYVVYIGVSDSENLLMKIFHFQLT